MASEYGSQCIRSFGDQDRREWVDRAESLAGERLRVLAVADRTATETDARALGGYWGLGISGVRRIQAENRTTRIDYMRVYRYRLKADLMHREKTRDPC